MKRLLISSAVMLPIVALLASGLALADVKTREKTQMKFGGALGGMINFFAGKAAKEGIVSSSAVKGNRRAHLDDTTGQIVDLSEEKVYDLDMKKKTYTVMTFEQIRRQMQEAREKAEREAAKQQGKQEQPAEKGQKPEKEVEVDFDVKETGQKKSILGYDTREVVMTITIREKGKTLEDAGGLVMTADSWMAPRIPALAELADFEMRYWQKVQGSEAVGMTPDQMAMVLAQYPMVKNAMERLQKEGTKLEGTPIVTTTTFDAVKSKEQLAAEAQNTQSSSGSGGGIGGLLAKKMMKKEGEAKPRATIFTTTHEFLEVGTSVAAGDLDIPAGFKEKK